MLPLAARQEDRSLDAVCITLLGVRRVRPCSLFAREDTVAHRIDGTTGFSWLHQGFQPKSQVGKHSVLGYKTRVRFQGETIFRSDCGGPVFADRGLWIAGAPKRGP